MQTKTGHIVSSRYLRKVKGPAGNDFGILNRHQACFDPKDFELAFDGCHAVRLILLLLGQIQSGYSTEYFPGHLPRTFAQSSIPELRLPRSI